MIRFINFICGEPSLTILVIEMGILLGIVFGLLLPKLYGYKIVKR